MRENLLGGPEPTYLPAGHPDTPARAAVAAGTDPAQVAAEYPAASYPWALLARAALDQGEAVMAYAYARTGYHRGLDSLRKAGWRGHGPIPADHETNQGFLMALVALGTAAEQIGEHEEAERCRTLAVDSDPAALEL